MNTLLLLIAAVLLIAQLGLPKKYAFLPLVIAACHIGNVEVLPQLTIARLLIISGLGRALAGGYLKWSRGNKLDVLFAVFSVFFVISFVGHKADEFSPSPFNARVGQVLNIFGCYLYGRAYLDDIANFRRYAFLLPVILIPLAFFMGLEKRSGHNYYFMLGGTEEAMARGDKIRAQGPFRHPILAGCAGATAFAFAYLAWQEKRRRLAVVGFVTCLSITVACASSGPLAAVAVTGMAIVFWRWRDKLRYALWGIVFLALVYNIAKGRGPWYLMASLDLVGGSTGWHRAKLIDQGFTYLNEWWLFGTDYTRHWMSSGVRWNPNVVDITNYYLDIGVTAGLLPMTLLIFIIVTAFRTLGQRMQLLRAVNDPDEKVLWVAGTSLATHAVSFVSISYFDQMYIFFYLLLGAIPALVLTAGSLKPLDGVEPEPEADATVPVREEVRPFPRYYSLARST